MDKNQSEAIEYTADMIRELAEDGINVHIHKKHAVMLFGAVIAGNLATLTLLPVITKYAKKVVIKTEEPEKTDGPSLPM